MSDTQFTVGRFTMDTATGQVSGSAEYMRDRFQGYVAEVESGRHSYMAAFAPAGQSPAVTFLVGVQTDYAGWRGTRELVGALS